MKKIITALCVIITAVLTLSLSSCSDNSGVPDGMQLVSGGESLGFYFYAPSQWTVANQGNISAVYASKVDTTSVTFVEAEMPEGSIADYFTVEKDRFAFPITVTVEGEACSFADADEAYRYVFTYDYKGYSMTTMQIFIKNDGHFYIFTFTSYNSERTEGQTYYQYYLTEVENIIEVFKFVERTEGNKEEPKEYEKDGDGYALVSERVLCGFDMYVPESYKVTDSSGIVSVTAPDGSNINVTKATYTGVTKDEYWETRRENLELIVDKTANDNGETVSSLTEIEVSKSIELKDTSWAFSYEYTYTMGGKDYHVYQVLVVSGMDGFVFTYTAEEVNYADNLTEAIRILNKIKF